MRAAARRAANRDAIHNRDQDVRIPWTSRNFQAALLISAAVIASIAYLVFHAPGKSQEYAALRADFENGRYQECIDRVVSQPQVFMDDQARAATANLSTLEATKTYPMVMPDADFLRRRVFYAKVAAQLKRDDPRETVMAVFNYVAENVASVSGPGEKAGIGVTPDTILLRGYGVCDRGAWLFCTLLENLRIPAWLVYLREPATGISHHTVAAAEIDGKLYLFDTYCGLPVANAAGKVATFQGVLADPASIDSATFGGKPQLVKSAEVANCALLLAPEPESVHPIAAALQSALPQGARHLEETPVLYCDYRKALIHLGSTLWPGVPVSDQGCRIRNAKAGYFIGVWDYPFRIGWNLRLADYRKEVNAAHPWLWKLREARLGTILGEDPQANATAYGAMIAALPPDDPARAAAEYFQAVALLRRSAADGEPAVVKFLEKHPKSIWREPLLQAVGEMLVNEGRFLDACVYLEQITGPRALRAAAFIQAARESRKPPILAGRAMQ